MYGDGGSASANNTVTNTACDSTNFGIGGYGDGSTNGQWFGGEIDEVRLSSTARTKAWIAASYKSGKDLYNTFGSAENKYVTSGSLLSNIYDTSIARLWNFNIYNNSSSQYYGYC
jgi:hypothetical protein